MSAASSIRMRWASIAARCGVLKVPEVGQSPWRDID